MTPPERAVFATLGGDRTRERFVRAFWEARGETELRRWSEARDEALRRLDGPDDPRVLAWTLAGPPADRLRSECRDGLSPFEVWSWSGDALPRRGAPAGGDLTVLFFRDRRPTGDRRVWWSTALGPGVLAEPVLPDAEVTDVLARADRHRCVRSTEELRTLERALQQGADRDATIARLAAPPADPAWAEGWAEDLPAETEPLSAARLVVEFPGRYQTRTILEGRFEIPAELLERSRSGRLFDTLRARGEIRRDGRLLDAFRATWWIVGAPPADGVVEVRFYRRVRPGPIDLRIRLEDGVGRALARDEDFLEVPRPTTEASPPPGTAKGFGELARPEVATLVTLPTVEILPLPAPPHVGPIDVAVASTGGPIERVRFLVDGGIPVEDDEPPWSARLDLGSRPRDRELRVEAVDPRGLVLARSRVRLRAAPDRLTLRLRRAPEDPGSSGPTPATGPPPAPGAIEVEVAGPSEHPWRRLVVRLGAATLFDRTNPDGGPAARFRLALPPIDAPAAVVEARAETSDGEVAEAVLVVGSAPTERLEVRLVELEATVVDRRGRLVVDLPAERFRVFEEDEPQPLVDFARVLDRPLDLALVLDLSTSMRPRLASLEGAARRFVESVLAPGDRASLVTFDHEIRRRTPFVADAPRIARILDRLHAWGATRLHDALYFTLASFDGGERRRALILLSDGEDVDSDLDLRTVHDEAVRSGIVVFPILLDVAHEQTRLGLEALAAATGGRAFPITGPREIDTAYRRIEEELRSRYLLTYAAPPGPAGLRRVRVEVAGEELSARSRSAYLLPEALPEASTRGGALAPPGPSTRTKLPSPPPGNVAPRDP